MLHIWIRVHCHQIYCSTRFYSVQLVLKSVTVLGTYMLHVFDIWGSIVRIGCSFLFLLRDTFYLVAYNYTQIWLMTLRILCELHIFGNRVNSTLTYVSYIQYSSYVNCTCTNVSACSCKLHTSVGGLNRNKNSTWWGKIRRIFWLFSRLLHFHPIYIVL